MHSIPLLVSLFDVFRKAKNIWATIGSSIEGGEKSTPEREEEKTRTDGARIKLGAAEIISNRSKHDKRDEAQRVIGDQDILSNSNLELHENDPPTWVPTAQIIR